MLRLLDTLPALGGAARGLHCELAFVRYGHTAISFRMDGFTSPGYTAACSLAYTSFRVRSKFLQRYSILQAHCMTPQGTVVYLLSHSACDLTEQHTVQCPMVQNNRTGL